MNKIVIRKNWLYFLFYLFVWIMPSRIRQAIPQDQYVFFILRVVALYLIVRKKGFHIHFRHFDFIEILSIAFLVSGIPGMILISHADLGNYLWFISDAMSVLSIMLFFGNITKTELEDFLKVTKFLWGAVILLSYFYGTKIVTGDEYGGDIFFVGSKDVTVQFFVTCFALCVFADINRNNRIGIYTWIAGGLSILFSVIYNSGQGMVMIGSYAAIIFLNRRIGNRFWKIISPLPFILLVGALYYFVVSMKFQTVPIISDFITNILHKDVTLTGRDFIFLESLKLFSIHPIFGYGYGNTIVYDVVGKIFIAFNTAHNSFIQVLIDYGVVGMSFLIAMLYCGLSKMRKTSFAGVENIYIAILAMCIGGLTGLIIPSCYFWIVFFIGIESGKWTENKEAEMLKNELSN